MENNICYGDVIYIQINDSVLFSSGFLSSEVYLASKIHLGTNSFRNGLFKVIPNLHYKESAEIDNIQKQIEFINSLNKVQNQVTQSIEEEVNEEKQKFEQREIRLTSLNEKILEEHMGQPIRYGQKVQFLHIESEMLLNLSPDYAKEDGSMSLLNLTDIGSRNVHFRFMPLFNFHAEGELLEYASPLQILAYANDFPITIGNRLEKFEIKSHQELDIQPIKQKNDVFPRIPARRIEPIVQPSNIFRAGIKLSENITNTYVKQFISKHQRTLTQSNDAIINNGAYVRIINEKAFLTVREVIKQSQVNQENPITKHQLVFERFSSPEFEYTFNKILSIFQIVQIPKGVNHLPQGKILKASLTQKYMLKHLITGKYVININGSFQLLDSQDLTTSLEGMRILTPQMLSHYSSSQLPDDIDLNKNMLVRLQFINNKLSDNLHIPAMNKKESKRKQSHNSQQLLHNVPIIENYANEESLNPNKIQVNIISPQSEKKHSYQHQSPILHMHAQYNAQQKLLQQHKQQDFTQYVLTRGQEIILDPDLPLHNRQRYFDGGYTQSDGDRYMEKKVVKSRFQVNLKGSSDEKRVAIKLSYLSNQEIQVVLMNESYANALKEFLDFFDKFLVSQNAELSQFNEKVYVLLQKSEEFEKFLRTDRFQQLRLAKFGCMREFSTYDMIYRIIYMFCRDSQLKEKAKAIHEAKMMMKSSQISMSRKPQNEHSSPKPKSTTVPATSPSINEIEEYVKDLEVEALVGIFRQFYSIVSYTFEQSPLNQSYCSQFFKIPLECLLGKKDGVFADVRGHVKQEIKAIMIQFCQAGFTDSEKATHDQINFYIDTIFKGITRQQGYRKYYLTLINHICQSKAPYFDNKIRSRFISEYLSVEEKRKHTLPQLVIDQGKAYVQFIREISPKNNKFMPLQDLNEKYLYEDLDPSEDAGIYEIKRLTDYLIMSLQLVITLLDQYSPLLNLIMLEYYPLNVLNKILTELKDSKNHYQIKILCSELMATLHEKHFNLTLNSMPMHLQVVKDDGRIEQVYQRIEQFIEDEHDNSVSSHENQYIASRNLKQIFEELKNLGSSNTAQKMLDDLDDLIEKGADEAQVFLLLLEKMVKSDMQSTTITFLRKSHKQICKILQRETLKQKDDFNSKLVKSAYNLLGLLEQKIVGFEAQAIIEDVKNKLQSGKLDLAEVSPTVAPKSQAITESLHKFTQHTNIKTITPVKSLMSMPFERSSSGRIGTIIGLPEQTSNKRGKKNYQNSFGSKCCCCKCRRCRQKKDNNTKFKYEAPRDLDDSDNDENDNGLLNNSERQKVIGSQELVIEAIINTILHGNLPLMNEAINQLDKITQYEIVLYQELRKFILITKPETLEKIHQVIKSTARLNNVAREAKFCISQNNLSPELLENLTKQVEQEIWSLIFILYSAENHYQDDNILEPDEELKNRIREQITEMPNICFKIKHEAVDSKMQKVCNLIGTQKALSRTIFWVANAVNDIDCGENEDKHLLVAKIAVVCLQFFTKNNYDNKIALTQSITFLRFFYDENIWNMTPDIMKLLCIMIEDCFTDDNANRHIAEIVKEMILPLTFSTNLKTMSIEKRYLIRLALPALTQFCLPLKLFDPFHFIKNEWEKEALVADSNGFSEAGGYNEESSIERLSKPKLIIGTDVNNTSRQQLEEGKSQEQHRKSSFVGSVGGGNVLSGATLQPQQYLSHVEENISEESPEKHNRAKQNPEAKTIEQIRNQNEEQSPNALSILSRKNSQQNEQIIPLNQQSSSRASPVLLPKSSSRPSPTFQPQSSSRAHSPQMLPPIASIIPDNEMPMSFYSLRELADSTLKVIHYYRNDQEKLAKFNRLLPFKKWIIFFLENPYCIQYDIKAKISKLINKMYFENGEQHKFIQEDNDCTQIFASIIADYTFFVEICENKLFDKNDLSDPLVRKFLLKNQATNHQSFENVRTIQQDLFNEDSHKKQINIYSLKTTIKQCLQEYLFNDGLDLLINLISAQKEFLAKDQGVVSGGVNKGKQRTFTLSMKSVINKLISTKGEKTIFGNIIRLIRYIVQAHGQEKYFPIKKIEKFFVIISEGTQLYQKFEKDIIEFQTEFESIAVRNPLHNALLAQENEDDQKENYAQQLLNHRLQEIIDKQKGFETENLKNLCKFINDHEKYPQIISKMISYLKSNQDSKNAKRIAFLLKFLRVNIEKENLKNEGMPIIYWKEINLIDLKKIKKIQDQYSSQGLTEIIFSLLKNGNDVILRKTISLGLAYLFGGNTDVQSGLFKMFESDKDNLVVSIFNEKLTQLSKKFRSEEEKRMQYLYFASHQVLFKYIQDHFNEKKELYGESLKQITAQHIEPQYLQTSLSNIEFYFMTLMLCFLQALCERQYHPFQQFLQLQKIDNATLPKNFDLVNFLRHFFENYYKLINIYNLPVGMQILDLAIEMIEGENRQNIQVLFQKAFIYDLCRVLTDFNTKVHLIPKGFGIDPYDEQLVELKILITKVFKTILENGDQEEISNLEKNLDIDGLFKVMGSAFDNYLEKEQIQFSTQVDKMIFQMKNNHFRESLLISINIYIVFRYLWPDNNDFELKMRDLINNNPNLSNKELERYDTLIFHFMGRVVNSVEVFIETRNHPLRRIWFPVLAMCHYLDKKAQEAFYGRVDRSNTQTKVSQLVSESRDFLTQMKSDYKASRERFKFNAEKTYQYASRLTNLLAIVINLINLFSLSYTDSSSNQISEADKISQDNEIEDNVLGFNIVQIILAFIILIMWWKAYQTRYLSQKWEGFSTNERKKQGDISKLIRSKLEEGKYHELDKRSLIQVLYLLGANSGEIKFIKRDERLWPLISSTYKKKNLEFLMECPAFIWHIMYFGICIGSLFHPIVAVFQVFDISFKSFTVHQIFTAVLQNGKTFLWTLFLLISVNLFYTLIGFYFANPAFLNDDGARLCDNAVVCYLNTLNIGLRFGAGIAEVIKNEPYTGTNAGSFVGRVIFDLTFFFIINIILLNLIFGMIIDAFGQLRDNRVKSQEDQKNKCFICGILRSEFERNLNFEEHVRLEHNPWSYIFFIVYIQYQYQYQRTSLNDIENYVIEKHLIKDFDWIPIGRSLELEKIYERESNKKISKIDIIHDKVNAIQDVMEAEINGIRNEMFDRFDKLKKELLRESDSVAASESSIESRRPSVSGEVIKY